MFGSMIRYAANTSVGQDTTLIRNCLLINNKAITNHNRQLQTSIEPIFVQNKKYLITGIGININKSPYIKNCPTTNLNELTNKLNFPKNKLYNLFYDIERNDKGTLKFQSQWFVFDQIIVSGSLVSDNSGFVSVTSNLEATPSTFL